MAIPALSFGDNEYIDQADAARKKAQAGGGPSFIASILDAVGIHRQVAKGPKQADLGTAKAADNKAPSPQQAAGGDGSTEIITVPPKVSALDQAAAAAQSGVTPLPMAPLSSQGLPRPLLQIDPDLGAQGIIKPLNKR